MTHKPSISLQPFVSRPDSFQHHFSQLSWERGLETFFLEKVPFGFSNSYEMAHKLISLLTSFLKDSQKEHLTILILGSGVALLPKHILDILSSESQLLSKKISMIQQ